MLPLTSAEAGAVSEERDSRWCQQHLPFTLLCDYIHNFSCLPGEHKKSGEKLASNAQPGSSCLLSDHLQKPTAPCQDDCRVGGAAIRAARGIHRLWGL